MPTIGSFSHDDLFGQEGTLETSTLKAKIKFVPLRDRSGKQPDYRILLGKREVGAAWSRTSKSGGEYLFLCCISVRDVARRQRGPLPAEPPISASGNRHRRRTPPMRDASRRPAVGAAPDRPAPRFPVPVAVREAVRDPGVRPSARI